MNVSRRVILYSVTAAWVLGVCSFAGQAAAWYDLSGPWQSRAVHRLVGQRRADFIEPNDLVIHQFNLGMSGPEDPTTPLSGHRRLMSGCRFHSCYEKAAVVLTAANNAEAVGIVHFHCRYAPRPKHSKLSRRRYVDCDSSSRLTMYIAAGRDAQDDSSALIRWARTVSRPDIPSETILIHR